MVILIRFHLAASQYKIMPLPTYAQFASKISDFFTATEKAWAIVNGPASGSGSTVVVTSGTLPTFAKVIADLLAGFPDALELTDPPEDGVTNGSAVGQAAYVRTTNGGRDFVDIWRCTNASSNLWQPPDYIFKDRDTDELLRLYTSEGGMETESAYPGA